MIKAEFRKTEKGYDWFEITGHAGYAEYGNDIVCSGVSSAVMLTLNLLSQFGAKGTPEIKEDEISYQLCEFQNEANLLIEGLCEHLTALSEDYPKHIRVIIRR